MSVKSFVLFNTENLSKRNFHSNIIFPKMSKSKRSCTKEIEKKNLLSLTLPTAVTDMLPS